VTSTLMGRQDAVNDRGVAAEAFSGLVVQVLKLAGLLEAAGNTLAAPAGQSTARWQVLAAAEHQPATVASIARALSLARQSVQRVADLLVADGLAQYVDNPAHQRAKLFALTAPGVAALRMIQTAQAEWAQRAAAGLDPDRLAAAQSTLADLARRLQGSDEL